MKFFLFFLISFSAQAQIARPLQFIALAFDGSKSIDYWEMTREFAANRPLRFTYFVSGVYWLTPELKNLYNAPAHGPGQTMIGWGGSRSEITERVEQVNLAHVEGHEIASHANGHFSGIGWSQSNWDSEFSQFNNLIFNVFNNVGVPYSQRFPQGYAFTPKNMVGFRAPYLDTSAGLWPSLQSHNFRYDTSKVMSMDYWPKKSSFGVWNFPLAMVKIAGTGKDTLSMDYNFYYTQSHAEEDEDNADLYYQQMYQTYLNYFDNNYNGNRAPIHIGHHFALWNGGAYWRAMKDFATRVCGLPEVRCVTYSQLATAMDQMGAVYISRAQVGDFPKSAPVYLASLHPLNGQISLRVRNDKWLVVKTGDLAELEHQILVNGRAINTSEMFPKNSRVVLRVLKEGQEMQRVEYIYKGNSKLVSVPDRALMGDLPEAHAADAAFTR